MSINASWHGRYAPEPHPIGFGIDNVARWLFVVEGSQGRRNPMDNSLNLESISSPKSLRGSNVYRSSQRLFGGFHKAFRDRGMSVNGQSEIF